MKANLRAVELQAGYGRRAVGPVVELDLAHGKLHAFIGPNGAGKSTLIRTLAGLQRPLNGQVHIGSDLHAMPAAARAQRVAFVASTPPASTGLTAGEVLALMPSSPDERRAVLNQIGDLAWHDTRLSELSDGQRQRVMIARAFLQRTPWILLDEPTAFLDARTRTELFAQLDAMAASGTGILLTTHDLHLLHRQPQLATVHAVGNALRALSPAASVAEWEAAH